MSSPFCVSQNQQTMKILLVAALLELLVLTTSASILSDPRNFASDAEVDAIIHTLGQTARDEPSTEDSLIHTSTNGNHEYPDAPGFFYTNDEFHLLGRKPTLLDMIPSDANNQRPLIGPLSDESILRLALEYFRDNPRARYFDFDYGQTFARLRGLMGEDSGPTSRMAHLGVIRIRRQFNSLEDRHVRTLDETERSLFDESAELEEERRSRLPFEGSSEELAKFRLLAQNIRQKSEATQSSDTTSNQADEDGPIEDPCPICLDELDNVDQMRLPCKHGLHSDCLRTLVEKNIRQCPVCRGQFSLRQLIELSSEDEVDLTR